MFFCKKKPWVRFVNFIPGVEIAHPVIRTQDHRFDWFKAASLEFKEKMATKNLTDPMAGTNRCPGIGDLFKTGFIITAPMDFVIKTRIDNPVGFAWNMPQGAESNSNYIGQHSYDQLAKFCPFRTDTLKSLVKVNTQWRITSSDDIVFLQMPLPYADHNIFTAAHGIIDCSKYYELNIQLFWHKLNDDILIEAGTPICQLIPIPRNLLVDLIVEPANDHDRYMANAWAYLVMKNYVKNIKHFFTATKKLLN